MESSRLVGVYVPCVNVYNCQVHVYGRKIQTRKGKIMNNLDNVVLKAIDDILAAWDGHPIAELTSRSMDFNTVARFLCVEESPIYTENILGSVENIKASMLSLADQGFLTPFPSGNFFYTRTDKVDMPV